MSQTSFLADRCNGFSPNIEFAADGSLARFGPLSVIQRIGQGGFGSVYRVSLEGVPNGMALKVPSPQVLSRGTVRATAQIEREGSLQVSMSAERHVVDVFDYGTLAGKPYLLSELVSGRSLQYLVSSNVSAAPVEVIAAVVHAIRGLRPYHQIGVAHLDLKPSNILLDFRSGLARITDLGIAAKIGTEPDPEDLL